MSLKERFRYNHLNWLLVKLMSIFHLKMPKSSMGMEVCACQLECGPFNLHEDRILFFMHEKKIINHKEVYKRNAIH